jgi:SEC-C motif
MPRAGRNEPCPCGSGRKTKRCCGETRGPSEDQLARAHLASLAYDAVRELAHLSDGALEILWEGLFDLPALDLSLHVKLPELITPEERELRDAIIDDDPDRCWDELQAVTSRIDTPQERVRLAESILRLRDQQRVRRSQAAFAIWHLNSPSQHLLTASVIHSLSVAVGATSTPGGLRVAA